MSPDLDRLTARLGIRFLLDHFALVGREVDEDFVGMLVFMAVSRGNAQTRPGVDPALPLDAGGSERECGRRAVSISELARELGAPFATLRRQARRLRDEGLFVSQAFGMVVPRSVYQSDKKVKLTELTIRLTQALVNELASFGIRAEAEPTARGPDFGQQVADLTNRFCLDSFKLLAGTTQLDPLSALIWQCVEVSNKPVLRDDRALNLAYAGFDQPPPDVLRQPVSAYAVAKFVRLPYETIRRHLARLVDTGYVTRIGKEGFIVGHADNERPGTRERIMASAALVRAHLAALAAVGMGSRSLGSAAADQGV